jgi:hypothetical protein
MTRFRQYVTLNPVGTHFTSQQSFISSGSSVELFCAFEIVRIRRQYLIIARSETPIFFFRIGITRVFIHLVFATLSSGRML